MRVTGGTGNIFTNYHLFVLHADILHISSFMYVNPVVRRIKEETFHYYITSAKQALDRLKVGPTNAKVRTLTSRK